MTSLTFRSLADAMKTAIEYHPLGGVHIRSAIREALQLARRYNRPVRFRFNGRRMTASNRLSARHIERQWEHATAAASLAYRRSPEHAAETARSIADITAKQATVTALVAVLPTVTTLDGMMAWLHGFTDPADRVGVKYDQIAVAAQLEKMGFVDGEGVGDGTPATSEKMGRWIVSQAINCLRHGIGPHPVTLRFVQDYLALRKRETEGAQ